jgi:hypothetical protein
VTGATAAAEFVANDSVPEYVLVAVGVKVTL